MPKYNVGDRVVFINDAGINWGEKTIAEVVKNPVRGDTYHITPDDSPWFDYNECNLYSLGDPAIAERTVCYGHHERERAGSLPVVEWGGHRWYSHLMYRVSPVVNDPKIKGKRCWVSALVQQQGCTFLRIRMADNQDDIWLVKPSFIVPE